MTRDNQVVVEFDSDSCTVKDKATRTVLLKGGLKAGLYQLHVPSTLPSSSVTVPNYSSSLQPFAATLNHKTLELSADNSSQFNYINNQVVPSVQFSSLSQPSCSNKNDQNNCFSVSSNLNDCTSFQNNKTFSLLSSHHDSNTQLSNVTCCESNVVTNKPWLNHDHSINNYTNYNHHGRDPSFALQVKKCQRKQDVSLAQ